MSATACTPQTCPSDLGWTVGQTACLPHKSVRLSRPEGAYTTCWAIQPSWQVHGPNTGGAGRTLHYGAVHGQGPGGQGHRSAALQRSAILHLLRRRRRRHPARARIRVRGLESAIFCEKHHTNLVSLAPTPEPPAVLVFKRDTPAAHLRRRGPHGVLAPAGVLAGLAASARCFRCSAPYYAHIFDYRRETTHTKTSTLCT